MNSNNRLDRHYGTFGHMGRAASVDYLLNQHAKDLNILFGDIDDLEIDNKKLKSKNKKLISILNETITDFNEMRQKCISFYNESNHQAQQIMDRDEQIKLLIEEKNALADELSDLKLNVNSSIYTAVNEKRKSNSILANLINTKNRKEFQNRITLKVAIVRLHGLQLCLNALKERGSVDQEEIDSYLDTAINSRVDADQNKDSLSYKDCIGWLNSQCKEVAAALGVLKKEG